MTEQKDSEAQLPKPKVDETKDENCHLHFGGEKSNDAKAELNWFLHQAK